MYENYIDPLINAGYIDRVNSKIDHRSHIYFPVLNAKQRKLFDSEKTNNLIYFNEVDGQNKEHQQPSIPAAIASSVDQISPTPSTLLQEQEHKRFTCFYCSQTYSSDKERVKHIDFEHPDKMYYPTQKDFENRLL
jgi:hypothetical protein